MEEKSNLKLIVITGIICIVIFMAWDAFFIKPAANNNSTTENNNTNTTVANNDSSDSFMSYLLPKGHSEKPTTEFKQDDNEILLLKSSKRVSIINNAVTGSIDLKGARIDSVILNNYKESVDKDSKNVVLLHPKNTPHAYFYESGFISYDTSIDLPGPNTQWSANSLQLTKDKPVTLTYVNKQGILFKKIITIDDNYMIQVKDEVVNKTSKKLKLYPWALVIRHGEPQVNNMIISHEGMVGYLNSALEYEKYSTLKKKNTLSYETDHGFLGFADKYFMVSLIPSGKVSANFRYFISSKDGQANYQADYLGSEKVLNSGSTASNVTNLFAGPKAYNLLHSYGKEYGINKFEDAIDFGWFFFITKPFLKMLLFFYGHLHNFGYAMLCFTIIIRLAVFPITYMSFSSMARMRLIQPQIAALKERYGKDMQRYNKAVMDLYRKEKVNPLAGCLPLLIQIPILFSIYKVIYISIEMRHAQFWWIKDLSAPDSSSIFNLFGLLPYDVPSFLNIGLWAVLMGVTMFIQQRLSGTAIVNPMQKRIMNWLPIIITFVLAGFPVGLLIYWVWSNLISIVQQIFINRAVNKHMLKHKK